jgi:hypothetical protein
MMNKVSNRNPYRFSRRFIRVITTVLVGVLLLGLVLGVVLGIVSDGLEGDAGETMSTVALGIVIAAFGIPLLVGAVLGGEAIARGAGVVGFLLVVGIASTAAASVADIAEGLGPAWQPALFWGGIALMALAVIGFWIIGFVAKVPMWLQLPILGSPRLVVQRGDEERGRGRRQAARRSSADRNTR